MFHTSTAGVLACAAVLATTFSSCSATPVNDASKDIVRFDLESARSAAPVPVTLDGQAHRVFAFGIIGDVTCGFGGNAQLELLLERPAFNAFGDAIDPSNARRSIPVQLKFVPPQTDRPWPPHEVPGRFGKREVFAVTSPALGPEEFKFVLTTEGLRPHRFLVSSERTRLVELVGTPERPALPDRALGDRWNFTALAWRDDSLKRTSLVRTGAGAAGLHLDPNYIGLNAFGDVASSTLMGSSPTPVTPVLLDTLDPLGRGRQLWALTTPGTPPMAIAGLAAPLRFVAMVGPDVGDTHRLLAYRGDELVAITPMYDSGWQTHCAYEFAVQQLDAAEQRGVELLRERLGFAFDLGFAEAPDGATFVASLAAMGAPDAPHLTDADLAVVTRFDRLAALSIRSPDITDVGLAHLDTLEHLREVRLAGAQLTPEGRRRLRARWPR